VVDACKDQLDRAAFGTDHKIDVPCVAVETGPNLSINDPHEPNGGYP
jgi:hypothetical protein